MSENIPMTVFLAELDLDLRLRVMQELRDIPGISLEQWGEIRRVTPAIAEILAGRTSPLPSVHRDETLWVEIEKNPEQVPVPLFTVSCPAIKGCVVTVERASAVRRSTGWVASLAGNRSGESMTWRGQFTSAVTAKHGEAKRIVTYVDVKPIAVYMIRRAELTKARFNSSFRLLEASPYVIYRPLESHREATVSVGVETIPAPNPDESTEPISIFNLSGDKSGGSSVFEFKYEHTQSTSAGAGLKIGLGGLGTSFSVSLSRALTLRCSLIGGYDYRVYRASASHGVAWATSGIFKRGKKGGKS